MIKQMLGKLDFPDSPTKVIVDSNIIELPLDGNHSEALLQFATLMNHDPFDRLLLAQAYYENLLFVTADDRLLSLQDPRLRLADATR
jgi:PIN domain nuclease of toxin-antitoxin system